MTNNRDEWRLILGTRFGEREGVVLLIVQFVFHFIPFSILYFVNVNGKCFV